MDDTGRPNDDTAGITKLRAEYGDLKYSADANYIIFRDIDLSANGENSDEKRWKLDADSFIWKNGRTAEYAARCRTTIE